MIFMLFCSKLYPFFQNSNSFRRNGDLWCVPCAWGDLLICYNAEKIDAPKKFDDLMDPSLKGNISFLIINVKRKFYNV